MEGDSTNAVAAEVSVTEQGAIYVGVGARRKLNADLDDKVKIEIPSLGRVIRGSLNSASKVYASKELAEKVSSENDSRHSASYHIDAIVKKMTGTWDDDHGLTEKRSDGCYTLDSKDL